MALRPVRGQRLVPGWSALGQGWRDARFSVVDLELTGLDLRRDEVVAYAAVPVRNGRAVVGDAVAGLVRPSRPSSAAAVVVHGLLTGDLETAPGPEVAADRLASVLDGGVLVAHAAWVERAMLTRLLAARGVRFEGPVVDTAALARADGLAAGAYDAEPPLGALANRLGLPGHRPHDALGDALTTAGVFLALVGRLEVRGPVTVRDLATLTRRHALH